MDDLDIRNVNSNIDMTDKEIKPSVELYINQGTYFGPNTYLAI
jgi:hypothetical protein